MVKLTCIVTKTGDCGQTSLANGTRVFKDALRLKAIGAIDELNSFIGVALTHDTAELTNILKKIQNDLFDLGADLSFPDDMNKKNIYTTHNKVNDIENIINEFNKNLSSLNSFILPGGSPLSAALHVCRTVARRAERCIVGLHQKETLSPHILQYINRLSDLFFILARVANNNGENDILWKPNKQNI